MESFIEVCRKFKQMFSIHGKGNKEIKKLVKAYKKLNNTYNIMARNVETTMYSFKDFFNLVNDIQDGLEKLERTNKNA